MAGTLLMPTVKEQERLREKFPSECPLAEQGCVGARISKVYDQVCSVLTGEAVCIHRRSNQTIAQEEICGYVRRCQDVDGNYFTSTCCDIAQEDCSRKKRCDGESEVKNTK